MSEHSSPDTSAGRSRPKGSYSSADTGSTFTAPIEEI